MYWMWDIVATFGVTAIFSMILFLVPHSKNSKILCSKPSLHMEEITSICKKPDCFFKQWGKQRYIVIRDQ
jgi:hypothetical protein